MHRNRKLRLTTALIAGFAALWWALFQPLAAQAATGSWSAWNTLSGSAPSGIAVASWQPGRLDAFATDGNGNVLGRFYPYGSPARWSNWGSLGRPPGVLMLGAISAVALGPGQVAVLGIGDDSYVWSRGYSQGAWSNWSRLGVSIAAHQIAAVSWDQNRVDVFVSGNHMFAHMYANNDGRGFSGWEYLSRPPDMPTTTNWTGVAATSQQSGSLDVFLPCSDGKIRHLTWNQGWKWAATLAQPTPTPRAFDTVPIAVTSWSPGRLDLEVADDNGTVHNNTWLSSSNKWLGYGPTPGTPPGGVFPDSGTNLAAASWQAGRIDVLTHAGNGNDYIATYK